MSLARILGGLAMACVCAHALGETLSSAPTVFVREVQLQDNESRHTQPQSELIPRRVFEAACGPYLNRSVTATELQALAQQLTRYLVDQGYVSSGVVVPD